MPSIEVSEDHSPSSSTRKDMLRLEKSDSEYLEKADEENQAIIADIAAATLSQTHRDYLLQRHGTLELEPIPSMSDADPYNWPTWKKLTNLILVAFHACMGTFTAASITPAYETIAKDLGVSLQRASYLTSLQIAILGGAPLLWKPLSNRFGRHPIFLLSLILSLVCNVGCAKSPTYGSMAACRALTAFFICPAAAIGSAVVAETFFKRERAKYMGVWTLMITLGVPVGPFIFGFVAYRVGYRWIYWILAITNGVQFFLYLFFGPETRYLGGSQQSQSSDLKAQYFLFRRIDPTPLKFKEFVHPLTMFRKPTILIPAVVYAMVFLWGSVCITVEVPQLLQAKFGHNTQQLGLQFLGVIIGSVLGEQLSWNSSDPAGTVVFLVCTEQAPANHWVVSPIVGTGISAFGNQIVTTVMITYAVDSYPQDAGSVGVFITFVRQIWGFIGPFWFPDMFDNVGVAASSGIACALLVVFSLLLTIPVHSLGRKWRAAGDAGQ